MSQYQRKGRKYGQAHHRSKLSDRQIWLIRWLYTPGVIGGDILAEQFECGKSTVRDIVTFATRYA
jgi:hypothetical protein